MTRSRISFRTCRGRPISMAFPKEPLVYPLGPVQHLWEEGRPGKILQLGRPWVEILSLWSWARSDCSSLLTIWLWICNCDTGLHASIYALWGVSMMTAWPWAWCAHSVLHSTSARAPALPEGPALCCHILRPECGGEIWKCLVLD